MSRPVTPTRRSTPVTDRKRGATSAKNRRASSSIRSPKESAPNRSSKRVPASRVTNPRRTASKPAVVRKKSVDAVIHTYPAAMAFLNAHINYERIPPRRKQRGRMSLTRIRRIMKDLGDPHLGFRSVHIAGSKGKGSTAAMLANMLANNGLKVGVYTSPHILDIRERIVINDVMISKAEMTRLMARIAETTKKYKDDHPTYFEILTALAFLYFAEKKVDVAVIETGLGGRLDATNIIKPDACGLTSISLDHMSQLGDSLEKIAEEKAGVFKANVPIVSSPQPDCVKTVLRNIAQEKGAELYFAGDDIRFNYRFEAARGGRPQARICVTTPTSHFDHLLVPLVGEHQAINCGVALGVLDQLKNRGMKLNDEQSINGLANVRLQGRMEMLCSKPRVLVDGAHNAASIGALMRAIGQNVPYDSMVVIFGCCGDKDVEGMLRQIRLGADKIIFTAIDSPRSADPVELAAQFAEVTGRMAQVAPTLAEAMVIAEKAVTREDLICLTGSFYLVSEAKGHFSDHPHRETSMLSQTA